MFLTLLTHAFIIAHYLLFAAGLYELGLTPMVFSFCVQVALMVICSLPLDSTLRVLRVNPPTIELSSETISCKGY